MPYLEFRLEFSRRLRWTSSFASGALCGRYNKDTAPVVQQGDRARVRGGMDNRIVVKKHGQTRPHQEAVSTSSLHLPVCDRCWFRYVKTTERRVSIEVQSETKWKFKP